MYTEYISFIIIESKYSWNLKGVSSISCTHWIRDQVFQDFVQKEFNQIFWFILRYQPETAGQDGGGAEIASLSQTLIY